MVIPVWKVGGRQKKLHLGIPHNQQGLTYVDKIDPNIYEKNYPEVPHRVHQLRILCILLVTGLVTYI
jgi:hypothetical protein